MNRHSLLGWGGGLLSSAFVVVACGDSTSSPVVPGGAPGATAASSALGSAGTASEPPAIGRPGGAQYAGKITVTGSDTIAGDYTFSPAALNQSCSDYVHNGLPDDANHHKGLYLPPVPQIGTTISGRSINVSTLVQAGGYHGVGDYTGEPFELQGITITDPNNPQSARIYPIGSGTSSLTTRDDGSGSLTFTDVTGGTYPDLQNRNLTISGKLDWTCKDG